MQRASLIFPHQLFEESPIADCEGPIYLLEEFLFFNQYAFHKQKIAFHRASMKAYAAYLFAQGKNVHYVEAQEEIADIRQLIAYLGEQRIESIHYIDPVDDWLERRIISSAEKAEIRCEVYPSPLFLNEKEELSPFFRSEKKKFFQTEFYISQRKHRKILLDAEGAPLGGKWSYDADNRKKYPRKKTPPTIRFPETNEFIEEAKKYVATHFSSNLGELSESPLYPIDFASSQAWLEQFLVERFEEFGPYEDAILAEHKILNHSVLTPMLNVGLLTPSQIVEETLGYIGKYDIPLNSSEGFLRQIIGWREFIRGIYVSKGREERTKNFWDFHRKIPASFYSGTTGIAPIDITIKKVLETGYCHHIERLMVLGNFMLLCEFDPDEVYRWFMELFIDAYDWVMVPNVYGMSQFADGGLMSTKPYISGSNYLKKMSNYQKGPWQGVWDGLFWRFMHIHRDFFLSNPRLGMLVRSFDKMTREKQDHLLETAEVYLEGLDS